MADDPKDGDPNADPEADPSADPKGKQKKGSGKPEGNENDPDIEDLMTKVSKLTEMVQQQASVITKLTDIGGREPDKKLTDSERLEELEATIKLLTQKLEADVEEKRQAEQKKKEALVDSIIKDNPVFKSDRDTLLKANENVLGLIAKNKPPETNNPYGKSPGLERKGDDWAKKIAAATQRRLDKRASRDGLSYK